MCLCMGRKAIPASVIDRKTPKTQDTVIFMTRIYYSKRYKAKPAQEKAHDTKSGGKLVQTSMSPLPVESCRTHYFL